MTVEVPGQFEAAFAARLRSELDAVPVRSLGAWPVMRRARGLAFASAAAIAVAAALILGTVGALAYSTPWVQNAMHSLGPLFHDSHSPAVVASPQASPTNTVAPSQPAPTVREVPSPTPREHESPEPGDGSRGQSPGSSPGSSPPPDG